MRRRRDQLPGLLPPIQDWTVPQLVVAVGMVLMAFTPWMWLAWILWVLSATP
jgi:hypothetical protein